MTSYSRRAFDFPVRALCPCREVGFLVPGLGLDFVVVVDLDLDVRFVLDDRVGGLRGPGLGLGFRKVSVEEDLDFALGVDEECGVRAVGSRFRGTPPVYGITGSRILTVKSPEPSTSSRVFSCSWALLNKARPRYVTSYWTRASPMAWPSTAIVARVLGAYRPGGIVATVGGAPA